MPLCPIALLIGCKKCPVFTSCPLKSIIGDERKQAKNKDHAKQKKV